ncbi:hypothetical protein FACS1894204_02020 [Synergistales bacterium]|nr:hypothetical protein FACS1894204_02020 [Synergistales bacterium]
MKLAGHTMSTPENTVEEALRFFRELSLQGAEIVVQSDYKSGIPYEANDKAVQELRKLLDSLELEVSCLTPYYHDFNSLDETVRKQEVDNLKRVIDMAVILRAENIRVYGGALTENETDEDGQKLKQLVKSMRTCGDYAASAKVQLAIENHFGTMTTTVKETMKIIEAIDHPNVGVLYDQANLAFFPAEEYYEAVPAQIKVMKYVHVKDLVYKDGAPKRLVADAVAHISEDIRTVVSKIPGDGILDWPAILCCLRDNGYNGWLSLEYERRWGNQNLPIAGEGLPIAVKRLRQWMSEAGV